MARGTGTERMNVADESVCPTTRIGTIDLDGAAGPRRHLRTLEDGFYEATALALPEKYHR